MKFAVLLGIGWCRPQATSWSHKGHKRKKAQYLLSPFISLSFCAFYDLSPVMHPRLVVVLKEIADVDRQSL